VFLEKYGPATLVSGQDMFWVEKKSRVALSGAGVGHGSTREYGDYQEERKKEQKKKATKDL